MSAYAEKALSTGRPGLAGSARRARPAPAPLPGGPGVQRGPGSAPAPLRPSRPLPPLRRRFLLENRHRVFVSAVTRSSPRRAHKVGPAAPRRRGQNP